MKTRNQIAVLTVLAVCGVVAWSPPTAGDDVNIGTGNTVSSPSGVATVIGANNSVTARNTLVVGEDNSLLIENKRTLVSGDGNTVQSNNTFVAGLSNNVRGEGVSDSTSYSTAIGAGNVIQSITGWAVGSSNEITGDKGATLGVGLKMNQPSAVAVGRWNVTPVVSGDVFVVGNGTSNTVRSSALRVTSGGDIIVSKAQGDISMGSYAN